MRKIATLAILAALTAANVFLPIAHADLALAHDGGHGGGHGGGGDRGHSGGFGSGDQLGGFDGERNDGGFDRGDRSDGRVERIGSHRRDGGYFFDSFDDDEDDCYPEWAHDADLHPFRSSVCAD